MDNLHLQNNHELKQEFIQKKKEISQLRSQLTAVSLDKMAAFEQLKSTRERIKSYSVQINHLKTERDWLVQEVKTLKEERNQFNYLVKEKASVHQEAEQKKKEVLRDYDLSEDPAKLNRLIQTLEEKIEIEVMPFSKETQIRKQIKELKSRYKKIKERIEQKGDLWKEINTLSADFAQVKRKAEDSHKVMKDKARISQEKHLALNQVYLLLKEEKNNEQSLSEKYLQLRVQREETKKQLEDALQRVNYLSKCFNAEEEKSFKSKVQEKTFLVQEKIKSRQKLSTEDILAFQALKE